MGFDDVHYVNCPIWGWNNSLGQSKANPNISDYVYLYVPHSYSALPFAPIEMEHLIYEKPT